MRALLFAFAVSLMLSACAGYRHIHEESNIDRLRPGESTMDDAIAMLGPPSAKSTFSNGTRLLQWQYTRAFLVAATAGHVAILFDQEGRMIRVTHRFQTASP